MSEVALHVDTVTRAGPVLTPSSLACLRHVPTVNLAAGCAHGCLYCYARGYSQAPGQRRLQVYCDTLDRLREELPRKRRRPRTVYFSPSSDALQPVPEVLDIAYDVFEFLLGSGVGVSLLTKGRIPGRHMNLLAAHAGRVHAGVGLTTLDARTARLIEPHAAPPEVRLGQAAALVWAGIDVQVRLDPILPGLTDDERSLQQILTAVADVGVRRVAVSTAFMRPSIVGVLRRQLGASTAAALLRHYDSGRLLTMAGAGTRIVMPSASVRRVIYARARRIAARYGIDMRICACKNSDLADGSCEIAGPESLPRPGHVQGNLFAGAEAAECATMAGASQGAP